MAGSLNTWRQCVLFLALLFPAPCMHALSIPRDELIERIVFFMLSEEPEALRLELEGLKRQGIDVSDLSGDSINLDGRWYTSLSHLLVSFPEDIGLRYPRWQILRHYKAAALWPKHAGSDHAKQLLNPDYVFGALITELAGSEDRLRILEEISPEIVSDRLAVDGIFSVLSYLIAAQKHNIYKQFLKASRLDLFSVQYEVRKPQFGVFSSILELFNRKYDHPSFTVTLDHACSIVEEKAAKILDVEESISLRTQLGELKGRLKDAESITKANTELRTSWRRAVFALMRQLVHQNPPMMGEFTHALRLLDFDEEAWKDFAETDELGRNFFHIMLEGDTVVSPREFLIAGQRRTLQIKRKKGPDVTRLLGIILDWGMKIDPNLISSRNKYFRQALCTRGSALIGARQGQPDYLEATPLAMAAMMGYRGFVGDALAFLSDAKAYERDDHVVDKTPLSGLLSEATENFVRAAAYDDECWSEKSATKVCQEKHEFLDKKWLDAEKKAREKFGSLTPAKILADIEEDLQREMESTGQAEIKIKKASRVLAGYLKQVSAVGLYHMPLEYKIALIGNCLLEIFKKVAKGLEEGDLYSLKKENINLLIDNAELSRFGGVTFTARLKVALIEAIEGCDEISFSQLAQGERKRLGSRVFGKLGKITTLSLM